MGCKQLFAFAVLPLLALAAPPLTVNPAQLTFWAGAGQPAPAGIAVNLNTASYSVTTDQPWLFAAQSGTATVISVNAAALAPGTYHGKVQFVSAGSTAATAVTLNVTRPSAGLIKSTVNADPSGDAFGLATADFNNDGIPDLAVAAYGPSQIGILYGKGDGTFRSGNRVNANTFSVSVGDFNNDGYPDLAFVNVVANKAVVQVALNSGSGFDSLSGSVSAGQIDIPVAIGDLNADGNLDLVAAGGNVAPLLGDGNGGFSVAPGSPLPVSASTLALGDFNGDGVPDLVVADRSLLTVLLGTGTGAFTAGNVYPLAGNRISIAVGDLNGDGKQDLAIADSSSITLLLGDGNGGFSPAPASPWAAVGSESIAIGDVNGDGFPDIAAAGSLNSPGAGLTILLGDGQGAFKSALGSPFPVVQAVSLVLADFNGDGRTDLAVSTFNGRSVQIFLGSSAVPTITALGASPGTIAALGQPVALTAAVAIPGFAAPLATVRFRDGATVLGTAALVNGTARFTTGGLALGPHTFYADYLGDATTLASSSSGVTVTASQLVISKGHPVSYFQQGQANAAYSILVTNPGSAATTAGTVTVTEQPPAGLSLVSMAGPGWTCSGNSCRRADSLAAGAIYPSILGTFNVAADAPAVLTNAVTVSGPNALANASDPTNIVPVGQPFGTIDTPGENATGLAGAVTVTGWALSTAGLRKVELWRDPVGNEPTAPNGLVFLEFTAILPGARPDVAQAYPGYPGNTAGWGAQLLTNELPNTTGAPGVGNGTYRIHAFATDQGGAAVEIDTRTITANNSDSPLPFGTIDTPGLRETISGTAYTIFGWALTPNPANVISILVLIDNQPRGYAVYNNFRQDIATVFPGLQNSNGAVGYFVLDTTKLSNGLHSMYWAVTDSGGNPAGIGSRYFTVQN